MAEHREMDREIERFRASGWEPGILVAWKRMLLALKKAETAAELKAQGLEGDSLDNLAPPPDWKGE